VLRVATKVGKTSTSSDRLTYSIKKDGRVSLNWGTIEIAFNVQ
jgi:hypothetical protein